MTQSDLFRAIVGSMILASLALGWFVTPYAFLFTTFIGLNMFQSAFTGFCPMDMMLRKTGKPPCREAGVKVRA
jgi:hypothetical protein